MREKIAIHWFRQDLRIQDNPALNYLSFKHKKIIGIFILDEVNCQTKLGSASKVWLYHSLNYLNEQIGNNLLLFKGDPQLVFNSLLKEFDITEITWNRCYEPWRIKRDKALMINLKKQVDIKSFNASLLWEPWQILKKDGTPYKIFTPFYKKGCLGFSPPRKPEIKKINFFNHKISSLTVLDLELIKNSSWENKIYANWEIGESFAFKKMQDFLANGLKDYADGRNFPNKLNVSRLSPYLHWGQISPHLIWYSLDSKNGEINLLNIEIFKSELGWREFFYNLLYHFPSIQHQNLQRKFDNFPWEDNNEFLTLWKKGKTGYPIVDAGMRELWETGYMHNRARMITGSFLVKNLLQHWKHGERWFWDCLFDADHASNSASWQWVAGTGTDAAPYFRIFNPITQGKKFDPNGDYIKRFVPELENVPLKYLFTPWDCPPEVCKDINFKIGLSYPSPIVEVALSREKALSAFSTIKKG